MREAIIVLNLNHIGDVLFTEPAIAALRAGYPMTHLIVITSLTAHEVLKHHPDIDELWTRERGMRGWWKLVKRLRRLRPAIVVNFSPSSAGLALAAWLSGAPLRFGFAVRPILPHLFTMALPFHPERHVTHDYLALAEAAGGKAGRYLPHVFLQPDEYKWGRKWLLEQGWDGAAPLLGCHPFSSVPRKEWALEQFVKLLHWAQDEMGWLPIIFGNAVEGSRANMLAEQVSGIAAAGRLSLRQFIAVAAHCAGFIGGDSGPVHIAAALGVPTLALFGPTDPNRTRPLGERVIVIRSPTGQMDALSIAAVKEALYQLCSSSLDQG